MARYVVAFDLDTAAMAAELLGVQGLSRGRFESIRTRIYQSDLPRALLACGDVHWKQGSLYHVESEGDIEEFITTLRIAMQDLAPDGCRYLRNMMVYPLAGARDVTALIADRRAGSPAH